ncbi:hypothetical protein WH384_23015, partial [Salmonella enterica subsp. enterica]
TGKTGNKPPENPPETYRVNHTQVHVYATRCMSPSLGTNRQRELCFWQLTLTILSLFLQREIG